MVFLKSRQAHNANYDVELQLEPQVKQLLDVVSGNHIAVSAFERRLPHLVNSSEIGAIEPLTLQSRPSQDIRPSSSNRSVVKEDGNASLSQPSEAWHEDFNMYLGDFVESLFDLLPSIRGIRRTRLLEYEFDQSNKRSSSLGPVRQATPQAAQTLPGSKIQSDTDNPGYINRSFVSFEAGIVTSRGLAQQLHSRCVEGNYAEGEFTFYCCSPLLWRGVFDSVRSTPLACWLSHAFFPLVPCAGPLLTPIIDVVWRQLGQEIRTFDASLELLRSIMTNTYRWHFEADGTWATILLDTLGEVTGDVFRTLRDCEEILSKKAVKHASLVLSRRKNANDLRQLVRNASDLRQRVRYHTNKILLVCKPFELHLLRGIHGELQRVRKDVAPLKGILIEDTARSIHPKRSKTHDIRLVVPPELAERFEDWVTKPLPLGGGFDASMMYLENSTGKFEHGSGPDQNIPEESKFVDLLKSAWIMEKLKDSDYLRLAGSESLWADCIRELEIRINAQVSRFDTGELEPPTLGVISGLPDHCFAIQVPKEP